MRPSLASFPVLTVVTTAICLLAPDATAAQDASPYLAPGESSGLPIVEANDNTVPAGSHTDGVREISLEVIESELRPETLLGPGVRVAAIGEEGKLPMIPAPLIRVEEGTRLRVRVRNGLSGDSITVLGLHTRPGEDDPGFQLAPGEARTVEFEAGAPGTYLYRVLEGSAPRGRGLGERDQLAGAFVIDPPGGSLPDRILVINIFSQPTGDPEGEQEGVETLTINGRSWPFTERMKLTVGDTERWRVVNASRRFHPMHLHGFFFSVQSRGTLSGDTIYAPSARRSVVTEPMRPGTTMLMEWTPTREGRWIFHCHLSFHVSAETRLPGAEASDPAHAHSHMAGLAVGIEVAPGPSDLVAEGPVMELDLHARAYGEEAGFRYGFTRDPDAMPDSLTDTPGPLLVLRQYQPADVTVHNDMPIPTGVHWHGLELDAWADGVPGWSASDGRISPAIEPGGSFTYRLSLMRPGTFMYHSHLDDIDQLTGGLYGAIVVLPPGEEFDPATDHVKVWGWNTTDVDGMHAIDLNGVREQPDQETAVGVTHRFRIVHIAPAGQITAWITRGDEVIPITLLAKDGADLPVQQRVPVERLERLGVGEAADFTWTPAEPGEYVLHIGFNDERNLTQRWTVR